VGIWDKVPDCQGLSALERVQFTSILLCCRQDFLTHRMDSVPRYAPFPQELLIFPHWNPGLNVENLHFKTINFEDKI